MYESPIEIITREVHNRLQRFQEEAVYKAVQEIGVKVDKEELLRALKYDRAQYQAGYKAREEEIVRCENCFFWDESVRGYSTECACKRFSEDGLVTHFMLPDDFCSYGERKDG